MNISHHQKCYCQKSLKKWNNSIDRTCNRCCKTISKDDKICYYCPNSECVYRRASGQAYNACITCYEGRNGVDDIKQDEETKGDFISNKFKSSASVIS